MFKSKKGKEVKIINDNKIVIKIGLSVFFKSLGSYALNSYG